MDPFLDAYAVSSKLNDFKDFHKICVGLYAQSQDASERLGCAVGANSMEFESIHDLEPIESGGSAAQNGFAFQNHVAAGFCLQMIASSHLRSVWCETLDDVTLIHHISGKDHVEFVQVKAEEPDALWGSPKLCKRDKKGNVGHVGTSVLERSLRHDRCAEACMFRIVSIQRVSSQLKILTYPLNSPARAGAKMKALEKDLDERLPEVCSPKKNRPSWWAQNTVWSLSAGIEEVQASNLLRLAEVLEKLQVQLFSDQRISLYDDILVWVMNASRADKKMDRSAGKIDRDPFTKWLQDRAEKLSIAGCSGGAPVLNEKLVAAGLDLETIAAAHETRRRYAQKRLHPSYLEVTRAEGWEDEVRARLQRLRAALNSGEIAESGIQFHKRSLETLEGLRLSTPIESRPSEALLQGCMYWIAGLCQHAFVRAEP